MKRWTLSILMTALCLSATAGAQTGAAYDREASYLLFPPNALGNASASVVWQLLAPGGVQLGEDASTVAELFVNGSLLLTNAWTIGAGDGPWFSWDTGHEPQPGDEIMVLLRPAPGALPDPNPSNDTKILNFDGSLSGWNRGIDSFVVIPNGDGTANVELHEHLTISNIGSSGDDGVDLSQELVIVDDFGTELHSEILNIVFHDPPAPTKIDACTVTCGAGSCGQWSGNPWLTLTATCLPSEFLNGNCGCGGEMNILIPAIPEPPTGGMKIILRPVPGALPELPGFPEEDDERRPGRPTSVGDEVSSVRRSVDLRNYPNPFNPSTVLSFELDRSASGELAIYDARGNHVRTLHRGHLGAGVHEFMWRGIDGTGSSVASGIYFVGLNVDGESHRRRIALLK